MELILVRHALPVRAEPTTARGAAPADPGLAPRGVNQANRLADFLGAEDIQAVYTSPGRRARETAAPLGMRLAVTPVVEEGIAEWDASSTSYVPIEEMKRVGDPRWHALSRGDFYDRDADPATFRARVVCAVEQIVARHPGEQVVLITHAGTINAYVGQILDQPKPFWLPLTRSPGYCSITRISAEDGVPRRAVSVNETAHVRDLLG